MIPNHRLLSDIARLLKEDVVPELSSDETTTQVGSAVSILRNIASEQETPDETLREALDGLRDSLDRVAEALESMEGCDVPEWELDARVRNLRERRRALLEATGELFDVIWSAGELSEAERRNLLRDLRKGYRLLLEYEHEMYF